MKVHETSSLALRVHVAFPTPSQSPHPLNKITIAEWPFPLLKFGFKVKRNFLNNYFELVNGVSL